MLDVYLKPGGLVWGRAATDALASGVAGQIGAGPVAFSMVEVIGRRNGVVSRRWHSCRDVKKSADKAVQQLLQSIEKPRAALCGIALDAPVVMGIINVTPDSFSDGGACFDIDQAVSHGQALAAAGAEILDVGGESTRPGAPPVDESEELRRVLPVVEALSARGHCVSIDSRKPQVIKACAEAGAQVINDVSALSWSNDSLLAAAETGLPVILMHAQGTPETMQDNPAYEDVSLDVHDYLAERIAACVEAGIDRERIIVDPGIGFGKTLAHNLQLLDELTILHGLGVPVMLGVSRKSFIGQVTGEQRPDNRLCGSIAAGLAGLARGAQLLRVHDVDETVQAVKIWQSI